MGLVLLRAHRVLACPEEGQAREAPIRSGSPKRCCNWSIASWSTVWSRLAVHKLITTC